MLRSFLWRGGGIHLHSSQDAPATEHDLHAHFALQLTVGWRARVSLQSGAGEPARCAPGWLTGCGQPHLIGCRGTAVVILVDPTSTGGQRLRARLQGTGYVPLSEAECEMVLAALERVRQERWDVPGVRAAVDQIVDQFAPGVLAVDSLDPRVRAAIESLRLHLDENISLADLAARAGVSESRFAHLFRENMGLPMRQYRLALRMEEAFTQLSLGLSLTESAHAAGFSDSAQFCRICRRMFGSVPSGLRDFDTEAAHDIGQPRQRGNRTLGLRKNPDP